MFRGLATVSRSHRQRLARKWRSTRLTVHRQMFMNQQDVVRGMCTGAKEDNYQNRIQDYESDQKKLYWLQDEPLKGKSQTALPTHNSSIDLANKFCGFFVSKVEAIRSQLNSSAQQDKPSGYPVHTSSIHSQTLHLCQERQWSGLTGNSRPSPASWTPPPPHPPTHTTPGEYGQSGTIHYHFKEWVSPLVSSPTDFKASLVRPLLTKPFLDRDVQSHYRPLSILAFLGRVLERTAEVQLTEHVMTHGLYERHQSAFHCFHSTETALVKVQNDLVRAIDDDCGVFLVLLDLSSVFDTLDHELLL